MLLLLNLIAPQPIPVQSISRLAPLNQSTTKHNGVNNDIIMQTISWKDIKTIEKS